MKAAEKRACKIDVTYSPDDGGYYAEVWEMETGKDLYQTRIYESAEAAQADAKHWIASNA